MLPLCNPRAVAPIDPEPHPSPSPSRPSPDPPPRAMAGTGDHQAGALSGALSRLDGERARGYERQKAHWHAPKSPPSGPGPEGDACADLGAIGRRTVVVLSAAGAPAEIFASMQDAIREARTARSEVGRMRVGLSGLSTDPRPLTAAMFAPCPNTAFAARQIAQLSERCRTLACFKADPIYCAIAAYHGSWERPNTMLADAVRATVAKSDAPNFSMPQDAYFDSGDLGSDALTPDRDDALAAPAVSSDDRERGWWSALFPAKPPQADTASVDVPSHNRSAEASRSLGPAGASATTPNPPGDSLFVPSSSERRP